MSDVMTRWACAITGLPAAEKAVLVQLAWHHNGQTGRCDPSNAALADETGWSERKVRQAKESLLSIGLIGYEKARGRRASITLNAGESSAPGAYVEPETPAKSSAPPAEPSAPPAELPETRVRHPVPNLRHLASESSAPGAYEQGKEQGKGETTPDGVVGGAREAHALAVADPPAVPPSPLESWQPSDTVLDTVRAQRGQWDLSDEAILRMVQPWRLYAEGRDLPPRKFNHSFVEFARRERVTETELNARMRRAEESHGPATNDDIARRIARANGLDA